MNVYQIMPSKCRHLYTLHRGLTTASIQDIHFNATSRWVAISSSHGTTRSQNYPSFSRFLIYTSRLIQIYAFKNILSTSLDIFAINPNGGKVNARTHSSLASFVQRFSSSDFDTSSKKNEPLKLFVCNRIKQPTSQYSTSSTLSSASSSSSSTADSSYYLPPIAAMFLNRANHSRSHHHHPKHAFENLYIITSSGVLTQYRLDPRQSDSDSEELLLNIAEYPSRTVSRSSQDAEKLTPLEIVSQTESSKKEKKKNAHIGFFDLRGVKKKINTEQSRSEEIRA